MSRVALLVCVALLGASACGPFPGGRLRGDPRPVPNDWSFVGTGATDFCEIESRPSDPHSIQLQCYVYEGALYVHSHRYALRSWYPFTSWAEIWIESPDVRVRIDGRIYDLRAQPVEEPILREEILRSRGYDPVPEGIVLFHLGDRTGNRPEPDGSASG